MTSSSLFDLLLLVPLNLAALLKRARVMASSMLVLPEPVGPVIRNNDCSASGPDVKSSSASVIVVRFCIFNLLIL